MSYKGELDSELKLIQDPLIRKFVAECINYAPAYFWKIPSSSTGKHHPADENVKGGAVLHTRRAVKIADDLCRNFDVAGEERDCVIAAVTMHDFRKNGETDTKHTVTAHGSMWASMVSKLVTQKDFLNNKNLRTIDRLISTHMGRFDSPYIIGPDTLAIIVQIADYVSSREYVTITV
jgi:hypothetical protein